MKLLPATLLCLAAAATALAVPAAKPLRAMPAGLQPAVSPAAAATGAASSATAKPNTGKWLEDYDEAVAIATAANLPIFLNFTGSDWCPWCKFADQQVFAHKEWREYAATHVVPVFVDFPSHKSLSNKQQKANDALKTRFGIRGFPSFLILSPDGEKLLGQFGISRDETFMSFTSKIEKITAGSSAQ
jgi:thiol:disulfide interchange protein